MVTVFYILSIGAVAERFYHYMVISKNDMQNQSSLGKYHLRNDVRQQTRIPFPTFSGSKSRQDLDQNLYEHSGGLGEKAAKRALRWNTQWLY